MNNLTLDQLLQRTELFNRIKASGSCAGRPLTQLGRDWINAELSAIEAELDARKPEYEFQTLLGEPVGFGRFLADGTWQSQAERDRENQLQYQKVSGE
jgi:hypothetical protein